MRSARRARGGSGCAGRFGRVRTRSDAFGRGARAATAVRRECRDAVGTRAVRRRDTRAKRYAKVADARGARRRRTGSAARIGTMRASADAIGAGRRRRSARSRMPARSRLARVRVDAPDAGTDAPAHDGGAAFCREKSMRMRKRSRCASNRTMPVPVPAGTPKPARRASHWRGRTLREPGRRASRRPTGGCAAGSRRSGEHARGDVTPTSTTRTRMPPRIRIRANVQRRASRHGARAHARADVIVAVRRKPFTVGRIGARQRRRRDREARGGGTTRLASPRRGDRAPYRRRR